MKYLLFVAALLSSFACSLYAQILPNVSIYDKDNIETVSFSPNVEDGVIQIGVQYIGKKAVIHRFYWGSEDLNVTTATDSFRVMKMVNGTPRPGELKISEYKTLNVNRYICEYIYDGEYVYVALMKNKSTLEQGRYLISDDVSSQDTLIMFDPETFEEVISLRDGYSLIKDGDWKEYNSKDRAVETGWYKNGKRVGNWTQTFYKRGGMIPNQKFLLEYNNGQLVSRKEKVRKQKK